MQAGYSPFAPRQRAGKGGKGRGGHSGFGPKSDLHQDILQTGYIWNKEQGTYYRPMLDDNGKFVPDLSQPISRDFVEELARKKAAYRKDPMKFRAGAGTAAQANISAQPAKSGAKK